MYDGMNESVNESMNGRITETKHNNAFLHLKAYLTAAFHIIASSLCRQRDGLLFN